jgi:glycosyltransferase involved in cell wall biosynthesis
MRAVRPDVALFAPDLGGGGAERVILNLARAFDARGMTIDIVLVRAKGELLVQLPRGVRVVDLAAPSALRSIPALVRYLRSTRPRAMLSALGHANVAAILARWISRVRCTLVVSIHNTVSEAIRSKSRKTKILALAERRLYPRADACIAVSKGVQHDFARATGLPIRQLRVIYNPVVGPALHAAALVDVDHPWLLKRTGPMLIAVGRLSPQKDYPTLFRALSLVREAVDARLIILGEGPARSELEALRSELGLNSSVDLPGFAQNPYAMIALADLFVLSSRYEGLPTALIEALALGVRVVSTDCPSGPAEILADGKHGRLVPIGDHSALAKAIMESLGKSGDTTDGAAATAPYEIATVVPQYLDALRL